MKERLDAVMNTILNRKSVRNFINSEKGISQEHMDAMLKAAFAAPSAVNLQPWHFIIINERALLDAIGNKLAYAKMLLRASAAIVVCGDKNRSEFYWEVDCAAATENILLAAEALGLGAVWAAIYPKVEKIAPVREILNLPEEIIPLNIIPIGYGAGIEKPKNKYDPKKIHKNGW